MLNSYSAIKKYRSLGGFGNAVIYMCYVLKGSKAASGIHRVLVTYAPRLNMIVRPTNFDEDIVMLGYEVESV